jgi:hypothetical protein
MNTKTLLLDLFEEAFDRKTWHGPNLWQSLEGVTAEQAAFRPAPKRHNIWEEALHAAYWKYAVRRRLVGGRRGSFTLQGSNFFHRPEPGRSNEAAWKADKAILLSEHSLAQAMKVRQAVTLKTRKMLWGVAFNDVYHAGQIRLLRRLMEN